MGKWSRWGCSDENTNDKERTADREACEDELKKLGYTTWKTIRVKYQNIDLFGLFDVLGLAQDGSHLLFIQCKSNRCDTETRDKIAKLKMPKCCQKWIYIWKDRKYWIKEYYD